MNNIICLWAGAIVDIPAGWVICDGANGTPDLRDKFVIGAGGAAAVDQTGTTNVMTNANWPYYALAFIMKL